MLALGIKHVYDGASTDHSVALARLVTASTGPSSALWRALLLSLIDSGAKVEYDDNGNPQRLRILFGGRLTICFGNI